MLARLDPSISNWDNPSVIICVPVLLFALVMSRSAPGASSPWAQWPLNECADAVGPQLTPENSTGDKRIEHPNNWLFYTIMLSLPVGRRVQWPSYWILGRISSYSPTSSPPFSLTLVSMTQNKVKQWNCWQRQGERFRTWKEGLWTSWGAQSLKTFPSSFSPMGMPPHMWVVQFGALMGANPFWPLAPIICAKRNDLC